MQSEGSSYKVTIFKNSEKPTGLHPLYSGIGNERVKEDELAEVLEEFPELHWQPCPPTVGKAVLHAAPPSAVGWRLQ